MNLTLPTPSNGSHSFGPFGHIEHIAHWLHALTTHKVSQAQSPDGARTDGRSQRDAQQLARNNILEVKQPLGVTIECLEGSIWVTLDGDSRDVVLSTGQVFIVDRPQRTLIQALETARIRLVEPTRTQ